MTPSKLWLAVLALLLPFLSSPCSAAPPVSVLTTVPLNPALRLSPLPSLTPSTSCTPPASTPVVSVNTSSLLQPLVGYGAAMTETTAYNFLLLKARNESAYNELLHRIFAPPPVGIALSFMRVPITSCDLSLPTPGWSYDDTPNDLDLSHFNTSHGMAYQIPVLLDVMAVVKATGGEVRLIGSPWSAPAWIKDSKAWGYGTIVDSLYPWYAQYLTKVASTFRDLGLPLYALTLQNEPRFEPGSYPGTRLTAGNETNLANLLHPALRAAGLDTLVAAYDHNWDDVQYPLDVMAGVGGPGKSVDVMAFHCYAGNVENQTVFHDAYPTVPIFFTECSQTGNENTPRQFLNDFMDNLNGLYFGNLGNWGRTVLHWTMAVDLKLGPHSGGCGTCSGIVTVDATNASVPYTVKMNNEYFTIGHFSSLMPPMSTRVTSSVASNGADAAAASFKALAAVTPQSATVLQLLNTGTSDQAVFVVDEAAGACFTTTLTAQSLTSFRWGGSQTPLETTGGTQESGAELSRGVGWMAMVAGVLLALVMGA